MWNNAYSNDEIVAPSLISHSSKYKDIWESLPSYTGTLRGTYWILLSLLWCPESFEWYSVLIVDAFSHYLSGNFFNFFFLLHWKRFKIYISGSKIIEIGSCCMSGHTLLEKKFLMYLLVWECSSIIVMSNIFWCMRYMWCFAYIKL